MSIVTEFNECAKDYNTYRLNYPKSLFEWLNSILLHHDLVVDCGTGNGQAASQLAGYFNRVIGVDSNENQLSEAVKHPKIEYRVMQAESLDVESSSVDLITAASAIHWFNLPHFYLECKKILKPTGYIAAWTYTWPESDDVAVKGALAQIKKKLDPYWPVSSLLHLNKYETLAFPFKAIKAPIFQIEAEWSTERLVNFLFTWAAIRDYVKTKDSGFFNYVKHTLMRGNPSDSPIALKFPLYLKVGGL